MTTTRTAAACPRRRRIAERGEEAMALEAIFDDAFRDFTRGDVANDVADDVADGGDGSSSTARRRMWTVRVASDDDRWSACHLEVHFPPGTVPAEPPLLSLRQPNLSPPTRRSVVAQLAAQAASLTGEAVVYTLAAWLQEHLPAVLEEHGEMDEEAAARAAAAAAEEEARREAEEAERAEVRLSGHSKFERTFARLEAREEAEKREEEERKKRMAYFRQLLAAEKEAERTEREVEDDEVEDDEVEDDEVEDDEVEVPAANDALSESVPDPDLDSDVAGGLDAKLRRWEASHAARVEAAKVATRAAEEMFFARRVVQPNTAVTKAKRAAEKAAAERDAAERAAAAEKAAALETSKGRRAAAKRLYAEGAGDDAGDAGVKPTSTKKLSWLTKHVKSMGLGDEERDDASAAASTIVAGASEDDEVAAAAAATLAGAGVF